MSTNLLAGRSSSSKLVFGIGLRRPHFDDILNHSEGVDFLEILSENYINFGGRPRRVLERVKQRFPIVMHGVSLSIGGLDPLNERYLDRLEELIGWIDPPFFSDHLSTSSHAHVEYHDLLPLPFTEEAIEHVVRRVKLVQRRIRVPFLLENPTTYLRLPGEMSEAEFIREVITRADCGLLLDINNIYVNAVNHGFDPRAFIEAMPRDRLMQYHMAGHDRSGAVLIDTHGAPIVDEVFSLYAHALRHLGPAPTLLEWDNAIPPIGRLLAENNRVRQVALEALGEKGARSHAA